MARSPKLKRIQDGSVAGLADPAIAGLRLRAREPPANRCDWLQSAGLPAEYLDRHRTDGVCCQAWRGPWDSGRSVAHRKTARTEQAYSTARDQSISANRVKQSSSTKWVSSQTPACCQSCKRRQQV